MDSVIEGGDRNRWAAAVDSPVAAWGVFLLGVALRLYAALTFPLEQDELYTLEESRDLFHTKLAPGIDSRPLYYLIQHPLLRISSSPFALRVLALLFGCLGLWVTWLAARRWLGSRAALVALLLAALSPWHLYASSMARYYSLVYLCAALVVLWLPEAYDTDAPSRYLCALGALVVGTLTHPSFVIAMPGIVLGLTLVRRDGAIGWRWPSANAWRWLWLPYLACVVAGVGAMRLAGRSKAVVNLGSRGIAATVRLLPAMIDWMTIPVFLAAVIGAFYLAVRAGAHRRIGLMTLCGAVVTGLLLVVASTRTGIYADYGIGMLPLAILCVAGLAIGLADGRNGVTIPVVVVSLVVGASLPSVVSFLSDGLRFDYRPAYAAITRRDPGGVVLGWPEALRRYYAGNLRGFELRPDSTYLNQVLSREGAAWAVVSAKRFGISEDVDGQEQRWLSAHCRLQDSFSRPRFDYRLYRVDLYACTASDSTAAVDRRAGRT